ncbi:hypothetical protein V8J88_22800 [Massilia sp. W12]|uniref:hypothetical protein n=1 Tax=Massilia sp. W12 TaxID=3126507 RepID=UPI0030D483F5
MMKKLFIAALCPFLFAFSAQAQTTPPASASATPHLDARQANQQQRIAQGIQSGQLTAQEAAKLEQNAARLEADKQAAKADGKVSRKEKAKLHRAADRNSRAIYRKKHNRKTAQSAG